MIASPSSARHVGRKLVEGLEALASDGLIVSHRGAGAGAVQAAVLDRLSMDVANDMLQRGVVVRPINDATSS